MSRSGKILVVLAVLALVLPLAMRSRADDNSTATVRANVELTSDASLAGTQVKAGTYVVKVSESTLTLTQKGKVIAEAPIEWKPEPSMSRSSLVVVDSGALKEFHFNGKNRYVQITAGSASSAGEK
jgi:hypothetical protein